MLNGKYDVVHGMLMQEIVQFYLLQKSVIFLFVFHIAIIQTIQTKSLLKRF